VRDFEEELEDPDEVAEDGVGRHILARATPLQQLVA
jgi:hypothetical protein